MAKVIGICKLCLKEDFLCESHVIPEYFFTGMYDEKHRALALSAKPYSETFIRTGFYERLLCAECEHYLNSEFETYAIGIWQNQFPGIDHGIGFELNNIDYVRFKLFHLSVLWRASVSSRDTFRHVKLGVHGEIIRNMILEKNPGADRQYPFFAKYQAFNGKPLDYVTEPQPARMNGHQIYVCDFGSCMWHYFVSNHSIGDMQQFCFDSRGRLIMPKLDIEKDPRLLRIVDAGKKSPFYKPGGKGFKRLSTESL